MAYTNTRDVRIEWGDCDPAGIIFYPNYFRIFDHSIEMLFESALGITKYEMFRTLEFAGWPLLKTQSRFFKPTRFGDDCVIASTITFGRTSFEVSHRITLKGETCVEANEKRVWTVRDASGQLKSHPIPNTVLAKFA
ncbi:MAG: acyl-CoA thioesterase [Proteobacteria bacterium]|nr:acyl-CoA thioesterase [Pseudomonadota bacterium]